MRTSLNSKKNVAAVKRWARSAWIENLVNSLIEQGSDFNSVYENNYFSAMMAINSLGQQHELDQSKIPQLGTLIEALHIAYNKRVNKGLVQ